MATGFVPFHVRPLWSQRSRTVLSVVAVAVGTSLIVGVLGLYGSLSGSVGRLASIAGKADISVTAVSPSGFDARLFGALAADRDVKAAAPMISSFIRVGTTRTLLIGVDERIEALGVEAQSDLERRLRRPGVNLDGVLLADGLANATMSHAGESVPVYGASARVQQARVIAVLHSSFLSHLNGGRVAVAPLPVAQRLAGKSGRIDAVLVVARPGADQSALRRRLTIVAGSAGRVTSPRLQAQEALVATRPVQQSTLVIASLTLFVAAFLVFNSMSLAVLERRQAIALLHALGARRRALLVGFSKELVSLALVASLLGCALGIAVAHRLLGSLPDAVVASVGVKLGFMLPWWAIPAAVSAALVATVGAGIVPVVQAISRPPAAVMASPGVIEEEGRTGWEWAFVIGGAALAALGFAYTLRGELNAAALVVMCLGGIAGTYGLRHEITGVCRFAASRGGRAGRIAAAAVHRSPRRVWATTVAVAVSVACIIAVGSTLQNALTSASRNFSAISHGDLFVGATPADGFAPDVLLPDAWAEDLRGMSGVASVTAVQSSFTTVASRRVLLQGVSDAGSSEPLMRFAPEQARASVANGTGVVVSRQFVRATGKSAGASIEFPTIDGFATLPVVAVVDSFGWDDGEVAVSLPKLQQWMQRPGVSYFEVRFARGADKDDVIATVQNHARTLPFAIDVQTGRQRLRELDSAVRQLAQLFRSVEWIVGAAAALAVFNTLVILVLERQREFGILRAIGVARVTLRRMVLTEGAVLGLVGAATGMALGAALHAASVNIVDRAIGLPVHYRFVPTAAGAAIAGSLVMGALGALLSAWRSSRINIIDAIGYE